jgi:GTP-binding protein
VVQANAEGQIHGHLDLDGVKSLRIVCCTRHGFAHFSHKLKFNEFFSQVFPNVTVRSEMWNNASTRRWLHSIAIVGRANVGKSSLFNRLQTSQWNDKNLVDKAIVFHKAGTTREGKSAVCKIGRIEVELHDTGGVEDEALLDLSPLVQKMESKVIETVKKSDVVLLVVDAKEGIVPLDHRVADLVTKTDYKKKVILVANKAEGSMMECVADCYELGLGDPVLVSAKQNEGIDDLYDRLVLDLEDVGKEFDSESPLGDGQFESKFTRNEVRKILKSDDELKQQILAERKELVLKKPVQIGIIGRPNAGKSSLLNALIREDRAIVDDCPGTTTDAIAVNWNFYKHQLRLVDTAGIMRGWKHATGGEGFEDPGAETMKTINSSHVCVLVIDAFEAFKANVLKFPSRQEVKLGHEVVDAGRCLVVAVNKWDLIPEKQQSQFRSGIVKCIENAFFDVKGLPIVFISTKTGANLNTLLVSCVASYRKWNLQLKSSKLNDWLEAFVAHHPPPWKDGQKQYPKFIAQTKTRPPTFSLYTNTFASFPENYLRQLKELMKEEFGLRGIPLRVNLRSTLMPKPGGRLRDRDVERWKRLGPKQAAAVEKIRKRNSMSNDRDSDELD